jgi:serine/threonine-protein kinase
MAGVTGSQRTVAQPASVDGLPTGASQAARYYEPPPSRTGWYALAAFFALIALGIGGVLLFNALSGNDDTGSKALKNYVGMPLQDAIADLDRLGLKYESVAEENTTVAEDIVHRTDPQAGVVVVDNQVIRLFYNPRKELQQVPNVEGQPLADAQRILSAAGFKVGDANSITLEVNDQIAKNSVIRTDPPAGARVAQDTTINLVVSSGPDQIAMPSMIGQTEAVAKANLEGAPYGFKVTVTREQTSTVAEGLVIRTNPPAQTLVNKGGAVTIVVSSGAPALDVPNVVGTPEAQARAALGQFDISAVTQDLPAGDPNDGKVTAQSVAAGQQLPAGSKITITVGKAAAATTTQAPAPTTTVAPTTTAAPAAAPGPTPPPTQGP